MLISEPLMIMTQLWGWKVGLMRNFWEADGQIGLPGFVLCGAAVSELWGSLRLSSAFPLEGTAGPV